VNAKGVDWPKVSAAADADGVKWWIAECEVHLDSLVPITESFRFLQRLGRCASARPAAAGRLARLA
jgi:hypothetical protein